MSAASQSNAPALAGPASSSSAPAAVKTTPLWERPAFYRYGFVALILAVWEITGPFISPIFFTYPSKIATACGASGTVCGRLFFTLAAGRCHIASAKSTSAHAMPAATAAGLSAPARVLATARVHPAVATA